MAAQLSEQEPPRTPVRIPAQTSPRTPVGPPAPHRGRLPVAPRGAGRPIRAVIAEDHVLLCDALGRLLAAQRDISVVGRVSTPGEAVRLVADLRPDVLLLRPWAPHHDPNAIRTIREVSPHTAVLHHLPREAGHEMLLRAVRAAGRPRAAAPAPVGPQAQPGAGALPGAPSGPLSEREVEVLRHVASAMTNSQIAERLDITPGTVKRHLYSVFQKLGAVSRLDAVTKAVAAALIPPPYTPAAR